MIPSQRDQDPAESTEFPTAQHPQEYIERIVPKVIGTLAVSSAEPRTFEADELPERLPPDVETALYRIAQEAINNALKHGQAKAIRIFLQQDYQALELRVEDNGQGFKDPTKAAGAGAGA